MKLFISLILPTILILASAAGLYPAEREIYLYTTEEEGWVSLVARRFKEESGVEVKWMRTDPEIVLDRLRLERDRPRADVWFGGPVEAHIRAAEEGLLQPYKSPVLQQLDERFRDPFRLNMVTGLYAAVLGWTVNRAVLEASDLPMPQGWRDLPQSLYRGLIAIANPNTSDSGYLLLSTLTQMWGEERAFDYIRRLHWNMRVYTRSGISPGILAGRGEVALAIQYVHLGVLLKKRGYPLEVMVPADGSGYQVGGISLIREAPHPETARLFFDWALGARAQELALEAGVYVIPTNQEARVPEEVTSLKEINLIKFDFNWSKENRFRLVETWTRDIFLLQHEPGEKKKR